MFDPFSTPDTEPETTLPAEKMNAVAVPSEGKVVVTLKGGTGFDSPWIVIHAEDATDALRQLAADNMQELIERTAATAKWFVGKSSGANAPAAQNASQGQQSASQSNSAPAHQQAPNGERQYCVHGERKFLSGISKRTGSPYSMFVCQNPDRDDQCKPSNPAKK